MKPMDFSVFIGVLGILLDCLKGTCSEGNPLVDSASQPLQNDVYRVLALPEDGRLRKRQAPYGFGGIWFTKRTMPINAAVQHGLNRSGSPSGAASVRIKSTVECRFGNCLKKYLDCEREGSTTEEYWACRRYRSACISECALMSKRKL